MEEKRKIDVEDLLNDLAEYVNPGRSRVYRLMGMTNVEHRGSGSTVVDIEGNEFIDLCAGYAVINAGHRHPRILAAVQEQLGHMGLSTKTMLSAGEVDLAKALAEITPGDLKRSFFCATGAEAVEVALKVARMYTGRTNFVAAENGFHGKTLGALSATGGGSYRDPFQPLIPGFTHVPFDDIEAMEKAVDEQTAAVILEPIQGEAGVVIPHPDYLPRVREICDRAGALLILDEVQTGIGRTGKNFACEHYGVTPDIMTLAKALSGGMIPVGAAVARSEVLEVFDANPWIHSSTTGGNALACAAATAGLQVLQEEDLAGQAQRKGVRVLERLEEMARNYPEVIQEVSGKGLLAGVRFTKPAGGLMIMAELYSRGVLVIPSLMNWTVMRIAPPLNIEEQRLEMGLDIVEEAVEHIRPDIEDM